MSNYVYVDDQGNASQISARAFRRRFPNVTFPRRLDKKLSLLAQYNVFPLTVVEPPTFDPDTQTLSQGPIVQENGEWKTSWVVETISQTELEEQVQAGLNELTTDNELLFVLGRTMVKLVLAARDGQLNGRTEAQVWDLFRDRVVQQLRNRRGL